MFSWTFLTLGLITKQQRQVSRENVLGFSTGILSVIFLTSKELTVYRVAQNFVGSNLYDFCNLQK